MSELPFEYEDDDEIIRCLGVIVVACIAMTFLMAAGIILSWIW